VLRKILIPAVLTMLIYSTYAAAELHTAPEKMVLTLEKAIEIAMKNNRDILIAREGSNMAAQQIREAKSGAFPQMSLTGNYTRTLKKPIMFFEIDGEVVSFQPGFMNSLSQALSVTQTLYAGGRTWTAIKIAAIYANSFDEQVKQTEKNIRLQVRESFLGLLLNMEVLQINSRSLENAEAHLRNVRELYNNGMAAEFDLLRAEVEVANARPRVIQSENQISLQEDLLKNLIGIPLTTEIEIDGDLRSTMISETEIEDAGKDALIHRNDYKNLLLIRDAYDQNVKIERAGWLPNLSAVYTYQYQGQSDQWDFNKSYRSQNVMLNLSLPLFDGFRTSARVQQARINVRETDYQLIKMKEGIEIQVTQAVHSMDDAQKRIDATARTVEQAQRAYDIARVRFESGQGTQLEIFDSQVALETAELNRLQSIYDYEIARAQWENAVGR